MDNVDVNKKDLYGNTKLIRFARNGKKLRGVKKFISKYAGIRLNYTNNSGYTALTSALHRQVFTGAIHKYNTDQITKIQNNYDGIVKLLLDKKAEMTAGPHDTTPLMYAAMQNNVEMTELLIERIESNDVLNAVEEDDSFTALMFALHCGRLDVAKFLIEKNADVKLKDRKDRTALMLIACSSSTVGSKQYSNQDESNNSSDYGDSKEVLVVEKLIEEGVELNDICSDGKTALIYAIENGKDDLAKILLGKNVDWSVNRGSDEYTTLKSNIVYHLAKKQHKQHAYSLTFKELLDAAVKECNWFVLFILFRLGFVEKEMLSSVLKENKTHLEMSPLLSTYLKAQLNPDANNQHITRDETLLNTPPMVVNGVTIDQNNVRVFVRGARNGDVSMMSYAYNYLNASFTEPLEINPLLEAYRPNTSYCVKWMWDNLKTQYMVFQRDSMQYASKSEREFLSPYINQEMFAEIVENRFSEDITTWDQDTLEIARNLYIDKANIAKDAYSKLLEKIFNALIKKNVEKPETHEAFKKVITVVKGGEDGNIRNEFAIFMSCCTPMSSSGTPPSGTLALRILELTEEWACSEQRINLLYNDRHALSYALDHQLHDVVKYIIVEQNTRIIPETDVKRQNDLLKKAVHAECWEYIHKICQIDLTKVYDYSEAFKHSLAQKKYDVAIKFVQNSLPVDLVGEFSQANVLHRLVIADDTDNVEIIVRGNASINFNLIINGRSCIYYAIKNNNLKMVKLQCEKTETDINRIDSENLTAIEFAQNQHHYEIEEHLLGLSTHCCARRGWARKDKAFLSFTPTRTYVRSETITSWAVAFLATYVAMISELKLETDDGTFKGTFDYFFRSPQSDPLRMIVLLAPIVPIAGYLFCWWLVCINKPTDLDAKAKYEKLQKERFHDAKLSEALKQIDENHIEFFQKSPEIEDIDTFYYFLLLILFQSKSNEAHSCIVSILSKVLPYNVNRKDIFFNKRTLLYYAIYYKNAYAVDALCKHGADLDWLDENGLTARELVSNLYWKDTSFKGVKIDTMLESYGGSQERQTCQFTFRWNFILGLVTAAALFVQIASQKQLERAKEYKERKALKLQQQECKEDPSKCPTPKNVGVFHNSALFTRKDLFSASSLVYIPSVNERLSRPLQAISRAQQTSVPAESPAIKKALPDMQQVIELVDILKKNRLYKIHNGIVHLHVEGLDNQYIPLLAYPPDAVVIAEELVLAEAELMKNRT